MQHRSARKPSGRAASVAALLIALAAAGSQAAEPADNPAATGPATTAPAPATTAPAATGVPAPATTGAPTSSAGQPTTIDAQRIEGISDIELQAQGAVELRRGDTRVYTESLKFNRELGRFEADGGVRLERDGERFYGPRLRYDLNNDTGEFDHPSYLIQRRQTERGTAEHIEFLGKKLIKLTGATFTTCRPGNDAWMFRTTQLELDYENDEAHAESPRLDLLGTTILALPYLTLPLENRRRSGVLTPTYSHTTLRGGELSVPFYWNIAPEQDATLTPVYMTKRGDQLKTQYRYLGREFGGEIQVDYTPNDQELHESRYRASVAHRQDLAPDLVAQFDLNRVSDYRYFVDFSNQLQQVTSGNVPSNASLSYGGTQAGWIYGATLRVESFQILQDPLAPLATLPYNRMPQLNGSVSKYDVGGIADVSLPAEFVQFSLPTQILGGPVTPTLPQPEGARVTLNPAVSLPLRSPGGFFVPKLGLRYATYDLTHTDPAQPAKQSIAIPWLSADTGLDFERPTHWFGEAATQTLEPRAFYVFAPYRNQDSLPLFDTGLNDFNYAQIFTANRFSGGDRFGDANELTLAATSRWLLSGAREVFRATLGQRYYFQDERVALPGTTVRTYRYSDVLASVGGRLSRSWQFETALQYNPRDRATQRDSLLLSYSPEPGKALNYGYRYNGEVPLRQFDLSGQWPVGGGWYGVGRYNYSLLDRRVLEGLAGMEYNGGCWVFRGVVQRIQASTQITSTALYLQLEFNGFGQIGSHDTVSLLKRDVPGYAVTNPTDPGLVPPGLRQRLPFEQTY